MSIIRFNPFAELDRMQRELNGFFKPAANLDQMSDWTPTIDIFGDENETTLIAELPGMDRDDIQINIEREMLTITGERKMPREPNNDHYNRVENSYGKFYRSFRLPETFDLEKVQAKMEKGVLTITLPKREEAKPRQIAVNIN